MIAADPTPTRMRREIGQIPAAVARVLGASAAEVRKVARAIVRADPAWIMIAGRGTSDHAAVYAQYLFETQLRIPTGLIKPSVTTVYSASVAWRGGLVIAISQSGRSPDVVSVVSAARKAGALTLAITNEPRSPLAAAAALQLRCHAGRELAIPATKTYVTGLAVIAMLVAVLRPESALRDGLAELPETLRSALSRTRRWLRDAGKSAVDDLGAADRALVISRGYNLATAMELALKLKETCGIFAEAYSSADFAHGPKVLAGPGVPTIAIRPDGEMGDVIDRTISAVEESGGRVTLIGGRDAAHHPGALALPHSLPEALTPLLFVVPGQLLVEATALRRGVSPDAPDGLGKVTLTR